MFDWATRLFGEGKIRFEGECTKPDGTVVEFVVKMPYIGSLGTVTEKEIIGECVNHMFVEKGVRVTKIRIHGGYGTTAEQGDFSGEWHVPVSKRTQARV